MLDYSDFTTERLQTMLEQGENFQEDKLNAAFNELIKRGVLTKEDVEISKKDIKLTKEKLTQKNNQQMEDLNMDSSKMTWKTRYYVYLIILAILGGIIIFQRLS